MSMVYEGNGSDSPEGMLGLPADQFPPDQQRRAFYVWRLEDLLRDLQRSSVHPRYERPPARVLRDAFDAMLAAWYPGEQQEKGTGAHGSRHSYRSIKRGI